MAQTRTTDHHQHDAASDPRSSSSLVPMLVAGILLTTISMIIIWLAS
jgi:hypothetical protein